MPLVDGLEQNSVDWLHQRCGMLTASHMFDVVNKLKTGKYSAAREKYLMEIVVERLTGRAAERYCTPAMERGLETEPRAKAAYEIATGYDVQDGGFWIHPKHEWWGASPDSLVNDDGLMEAKCPNTVTHLEYLEADVVPLEYAPQMLAQLCCTERKWCDFVSFDDRLPASLQLFVKRFTPTQEMLEVCELEAKTFLEDVVLRLGKLAARVEVAELAK